MTTLARPLSAGRTMMESSSFRRLSASRISFVMLGSGGSACWRILLTALLTVSACSASSCLTADSTLSTFYSTCKSFNWRWQKLCRNMSCKLKKLVVFLKIFTSLLLLLSLKSWKSKRMNQNIACSTTVKLSTLNVPRSLPWEKYLTSMKEILNNTRLRIALDRIFYSTGCACSVSSGVDMLFSFSLFNSFVSR